MGVTESLKAASNHTDNLGVGFGLEEGHLKNTTNWAQKVN